MRPRPTVVLGTNLVLAGTALAWVLWRYGGPAIEILGRAPSAPLLGLLLVLVATALAGYALRWRIVLGGLGRGPGVPVLTAYRAAAQSVSTLLPSAKLGGEPLRAWLVLRDRVPAAGAIASVAVDRTLDMGASAAFALCFVVILVRHGVPALEGALVTVSLGTTAVALGIVVMARRLRRGAGLVTAVARSTGLDRLGAVGRQMDVLAAAEADATRLVAQPGRLAGAFAVGVGVNLLVLVEYWVLLAAFDLPTTTLAVVAAIFATGAAHSVPVPAGVGVLEGAQMFLFSALGHPPAVGLAVGLAVRLRELLWILPGLLYLAGRGLAARHAHEATA